MWSPTSQFTSTTSRTLKEGTAAKGTYTVTESFNVPQAAWGMYYVAFFLIGQGEPTGSLYNSQFNVLPRLKAEPVSISPGATTTLYGTGFPANEPVTLTFDSTFTSINVSPNNTGSFTTSFIVPNAVSGQHNIGGRSDKLVSGLAPATILVVPGVTVDPKNPQSGAKVTISGRGFAANSNIAIKHNDLTVTNSPGTDSTGNFSYSFTLPADSAKSHTFTVADEDGHIITYSPSIAGQKTTPAPLTTLVPQPPSQPSNSPSSPNTSTAMKTLSKPATMEPKGQSFGILGAQPVNFIWSQVSASGGVTYTLEIADNYNFSSVNPAMRVSGLTQTNFTMVLEPGTYYWRVKAADGTSNEGEWSYSLYSFKVGLFPTWVIAAGVIVYIILLCWLIKTLINRRNRYPY
jgi:hypothetical protein